jgi:hypothetical protein
MLTIAVMLATLAACSALLWLVGAREPVYAISGGDGPHWFIAIRGEPGPLAPGVTQRFASRADFNLIGANDAYWHHFIIASGGDAHAPPIDTHGAEDGYVARLDLRRPPHLLFGLLKTLIALGVLSKPSGPAAEDVGNLGVRPDIMPTRDAIAQLLARPPSYAPVMVNFLAYEAQAQYADGRAPISGRAAYMRYGAVALRTVYRTGGRLLFAGRVVAVLRRATKGPAVGRWDEVAAMQYPNPPAILSMEHAPDYRAALHHRDAGLERTLVVASARL